MGKLSSLKKKPRPWDKLHKRRIEIISIPLQISQILDLPVHDLFLSHPCHTQPFAYIWNYGYPGPICNVKKENTILFQQNQRNFPCSKWQFNKDYIAQ